MTGRLLCTIAAAVGAASTSAVALPAAHGTPRAGDTLRVRTMTLVESNGEADVTRTDVPPAGASVGDRTTITGRLSDAAGGRRLGSVVFRCVLIDAGAEVSSCQLVHTLAGGTLTADGTIYDTPSWVAITGGTGKYRGARGAVHLLATNGPSTAETFYLISGRATSTADSALERSAEPAHVGSPSSIVALGDSGSTGYNSATPNRDAPANSWATGSSPEVRSHYLRILAANPRIRGHAVSFAHDGDRIRDLLRQAKLAASTRADYVTVDLGGNDLCGGNDTSAALFRSQLAAGLRAVTRSLPNARILVLGLGSPAAYFQALKRIPAARAALTDGGPCDPLFDANDEPDPARVAFVEAKVRATNALLAAGCAAFVHCRYDGNSQERLTIEPGDFSPDWGHPSVQGLAKKAAITWEAGFDFGDAVAPVSAAKRSGRSVTLSAADERGVAGIEYRLGKGGWIRYSRAVTVPKGVILTWRAVDVNGNCEATHSLKGA